MNHMTKSAAFLLLIALLVPVAVNAYEKGTCHPAFRGIYQDQDFHIILNRGEIESLDGDSGRQGFRRELESWNPNGSLIADHILSRLGDVQSWASPIGGVSLHVTVRGPAAGSSNRWIHVWKGGGCEGPCTLSC